MKEKIENPQAFPYGYGTDVYERAEVGMTLRDYFATKAIQTPVSYRPRSFYDFLKWFFGYNYKACSRPHDQNAIQAYELADEMLKQRSL